MTKWQSCYVYLPTGRVVAVYRYTEGRKAAKVGADSPRYLDCGTPDSVKVMNLYRNTFDVTSEFSDGTIAAIETAIRRGTVSGRAPVSVMITGDDIPAHFKKRKESMGQYSLDYAAATRREG